ncbi:MAG: ATP-binding protein [Chloroflexi bacterium]|nr:ATP-binding protein [Chloroflexota bacterium]MDA8188113.1 ATP-binding protein [Dehalococcoidales bacterium]
MLKLSLRNKLILSALLVLAPVLILLIQNFTVLYAVRKDDVLSNQVRVAQVVGVAVDDSFDQAMGIAQSYATDPVILTFDRERINNYLARLAPIYPQYDTAVDVFDIHGDLVGSSGGFRLANVYDRAWFQDFVRGRREPIVVGVLMSRVTGKPIAPVVAPITGANGGLVGAVGSALSLQHFPETLEAVQLAPGQGVFLADRTGRLAFCTGKPDLTMEERDASGYLPIRTALEGRVFVGERTVGLFGGERMVVAVPTPKYGWVVGVSMPANVALAPVQEAMRNNVIIFATVVVFSIGLALALAELLARPLKQLSENAVAFGRGDLQRWVKINTGDELERLGNSFNAMADEVQRAMQLREQFLAVASHELRTPLTIIKGYSQLLLSRETNEENRKVLQIVVRQTDRISELVSEMLTVSELHAGHVELHRKKMDLAALTKEVADRLQMITDKHRLLVRADVETVVDADRNQVDVVLTNLIDNAIRYSPRGGDVEITVSKMDGEAVVSVKDYGLGIPEEKQRHVFEPFFQIQPGIAGFGGMGLGLFISKEIAERHGGKIWFESEEGSGSTFYFKLPLT